MSWYNPSQDEAADEYYASKSRYANAANQKNAAIKAAASCLAEKVGALSAINSCASDKLNFEQRIEDIQTIINAIEGTGNSSLTSAMGADLPTLITESNTSAQQTDDSYQQSIKCADISPVELSDVFKYPSVSEDSLLSEALSLFKKEMQRLQDALAELETQMNTLTNLVSELTSKINMYTDIQLDCNKIMISSAFDMNHFKLYM